MTKTGTKKTKAAAEQVSVVAYKGLDQNFRCRGYQFEVGKTYEQPGKIVACENGFHACEHPLNIFDYYAPALSRFAHVAYVQAHSLEAPNA